MALWDSTWNFMSVYIPAFFKQFFVAIVILLLGFVIAKIAGRLVHKFLEKIELNAAIKQLAKIDIKLEQVAGSFTTYFIYFITIVMVLQQLGLATTVLNMIAGGVIIIIILSTFLGVKDLIPNIISGFVLQRKSFIKVGERIKVKGMVGKVTSISLVETQIKTKTGDTIFIPNSVMAKTEIVKVGKHVEKH